MIFYATCLTAVLKQERNLFLLYSALYIKINVKIIKLMQKRSSQLNMQLTQLRKENTSIAEVRVWIPASLNFLRLSFCNCVTISAFTSSSCSSSIWNCFSFTEGWSSPSIVWLTLGKFLSPFNPLTGLYHNINFVIHILQLLKPSWNRRNPLSVVVLEF